MGNQMCFGLHLIFVSLFALATRYACLGAPNITVNCSEQERQALLKFKHSVKDDFRMLSSWVGIDCCSWERVQCDGATGSVIGLHLRGNMEVFYSCNGPSGGFASDYLLVGEEYYLVGEEVTSSLAELRHLKYLDLSLNYFQGSGIPEFIGSLRQLSYLNLSNAGFGGNIPHQIGNLSNLEVLDLNSLSFSQEMMEDDMAWISSLSSLKHLDLNGVDLSRAENRYMLLNMIPSLVELSLSCCGFSNADLGEPYLNTSRMLPNIKHLDLSFNAIEGEFPSVLANLSSLVKLDLSYNNFGLLDHIGIWRWCNLKELIVSQSNLGGKMIGPSTNVSICSQYALEVLDLSGNKLDGLIPKAFGRLRTLEVLDLSFNKFDGPIPTFIGQLTNLDLSYNRLNGTIPESFGSLTALTFLNLQRNQLTGPIPASLGRLTSLQSFMLSSNLLNGAMPVSIGQLAKLNFLDVSGNSLEGVVLEDNFANMSMLEYLDLSSNRNLTFNVSSGWIPPFQLHTIRLGSCKISNEFPQWFQTQKKLDELVLSNASVSGPLPTWLQKIPIIHVLDLSHNKLSGPLTNLPFGDPLNGIQHGYRGSLLLQNNLFNGLIPRSLCSRTDLDILNLSRNRLTGKIPNCFVNLQNLRMMIFGSNRLSGVIPSSLGHISPSLAWLSLNDNDFGGELPIDLGKLQTLRVLDLGNNKFFGKIPEWIGEKLTSLMVLRLHRNNFTGRIPHSLCKNSRLQILDVAQNGLTGQVPSCFGKLYGMVEASHEDIRNGSSSSNSDVNVLQVMKGVDLEYSKTLDLVFNMDLSSNKLAGQIPEELMKLSLLVGLNLSHNHLGGAIPNGIGQMKALNSLDLSENELTGVIPPSIASLNFLSHLNLSHNNLSGRIPTGSQLQTFTDPSIYAGNRYLCGAPLPKNCSNFEVPTTMTSTKKHEAADEPEFWFYLGMMCGFPSGFWSVIGVMLFKKRWREKLFMFVEETMDKIKLAVMVRISKIKKGKISHIHP